MNQYANDFTDTVKIYYNDLKTYKPLSRAQEKRLLKLAKRGDLASKNKILEANLRFVFDTAKKYTGRGVPISELISEGNMGLIRAIEKYDESKDVKFISYAVWWIRQRMLEAIRKSSSSPFVELESESDSISVLEKTVPDEEDEYITQYDTKYSNETELRASEISCNQKSIVNDIVDVLSDRERYVIEMYYGINNKKEHTLNEIGKEMKISAERVRQVKLSAIRKLRSKIMLFDNMEDLF